MLALLLPPPPPLPFVPYDAAQQAAAARAEAAVPQAVLRVAVCSPRPSRYDRKQGPFFANSLDFVSVCATWHVKSKHDSHQHEGVCVAHDYGTGSPVV